MKHYKKAFEAQTGFKYATDVIESYYNSEDQFKWGNQFSAEQLSYMLDLFDGYDLIDTYCAVRDALIGLKMKML